MIENILKREDVKEFLAEVLSQVKFNQKDIPNTFCEEKITQKQYSLFICLDAIVKYYILLKDYRFDIYLEQLRRIMKKLQTHHDITTGINRLLIKEVKNKLGIKEESSQSKKIVIKYFYDHYIKEGYLFHSFSECFYEEDQGLETDHYYYQFEQMKNINNLVSQYKVEKPFSKDFEGEARISFTDSFFMASFYAYHCPLFLYELSTKLIKNDDTEEEILNHFFLKDNQKCYQNLDQFLKKKEIPLADKNKILNFFQTEWKNLDVSNSGSVVAFIKRNTLQKDSLEEYSKLLHSEEELETIISHLLDTRLNDNQIFQNIKPEFYLKLPRIKDILTEKEENQKQEEVVKIDNSYGNATIVALFGILLITLGITITIIMMGR